MLLVKYFYRQLYYLDLMLKSISTGNFLSSTAYRNNYFHRPLVLVVVKNASVNRFTTASIELLCTSGH